MATIFDYTQWLSSIQDIFYRAPQRWGGKLPIRMHSALSISGRDAIISFRRSSCTHTQMHSVPRSKEGAGRPACSLTVCADRRRVTRMERGAINFAAVCCLAALASGKAGRGFTRRVGVRKKAWKSSQDACPPGRARPRDSCEARKKSRHPAGRSFRLVNL